MTPLRQFKGVPAEIIRKAEAKQFVSQYMDKLSFVHVLIVPYSPGTATLTW